MKRRAWLVVSSLGMGGWLSGCATRPPRATTSTRWTGRLSLAVASEPAQFFSAEFELQGNASAGELMLYGPLGGTLARITWNPSHAELHSSSVQIFASLDALTQTLTGTALPVAALFDWLQGQATPAAGWQADLSRLPEGRLSAQRHNPAPSADLRLILER